MLEMPSTAIVIYVRSMNSRNLLGMHRALWSRWVLIFLAVKILFQVNSYAISFEGFERDAKNDIFFAGIPESLNA